MTFVKLLFAVLILIPVVIIMWYLINKLIEEFTDSVKKARDDERAKEKAFKDKREGAVTRNARYGRLNQDTNAGHLKAIHQDTNEQPKNSSASRVKNMADKRKRRKERKAKKMNSMKKDEE